VSTSGDCIVTKPQVYDEVKGTDAPLAPLVVDLDGTLTPTDTLVESALQLVKREPLLLLALPLWIAKGRAAFKESVASRRPFPVDHLPLREDFVEFLREERARGRRIVLATAAHRDVANAVAARLNLFDAVLATRNGTNLKGAAKLESIRESVGDNFVYAGDSAADVPIWRGARAAILVGVGSGLAREIRRTLTVAREFPADRAGLRTWLRAIRVHQWLKNLLLFVPLLTAFSFLDAAKLVAAIGAFFAFGLTASASYIGNDLWDLESDRRHPRKRGRPFASGRISIVRGIAAAAVLLSAGVLLAAGLSLGFLVVLLLYLVTTTVYSWKLKKYVLLDVLTLSILYTLRIVAGSVAVGVATSSWLFAFSVFIFFSLALLKRCSELVALGSAGHQVTIGRDYRVTDLVVLWPLGVGAALCAVVVFGFFISAPETQSRYATPQLLWLVAAGLIYWLARLWIKTARGEMDDDPIVFAVRDFGSRVTVAAMIGVTLFAHVVNLGAP
jgi:4-hydroxybenzoate polyprenyltransferase/phosphoserine phosphatase